MASGDKFAQPRGGRPEAFVIQGRGSLRTKWSPNALGLESESTGGLAVVNQNYHEGWVAADGREVRAWRGLLAVPISPGADRIDLRFAPSGFAPGASIALGVALLLSLAARRFESTSAPRH